MMTHPVTAFMLQRNSTPSLSAPAPSGAVLDSIFQAALRAPDHGRLRPWRYLIIEGDSLNKLGDLFAESAKASDSSLSLEQEKKFRKMPLRAPMVIVAIAKVQSHHKIPEIEQTVSLGVGVGYLLLALQAEGFGGMWRTGPLAYNKGVHKGLGLAEGEHIVGFLYAGTPEGKSKSVPQNDMNDFVTRWA